MIATGDLSEGSAIPVRSLQPRQSKNAGVTAALVLAGLLSVPVLAATDRDLLCEATTATAPSAGADEFVLQPASKSEAPLRERILKLRTDAAVRGTFSDDELTDEADRDAADSADTEAIAAKPGIRSASEGKRGTYRRQMYRRDI